MSFIKKISLVFSVLIATVFTGTAFAQEVKITSKIEPADCFDYYKFQSVQVSVGPEKDIYNTGETIKFSGEVINENNYPVVDGNVFVRISKINSNTENVNTVWHDVADEFFGAENVVIDASSTKVVNFSWQVPVSLGQGDYRADYFFSVGKKFNLGGLPFTNEIVVGTSYFKVESSVATAFKLDRTETKVNNEAYNHIGNWPFVVAGEKVEFRQPLKNLTDKEIEFDIQYDLYYWDSLRKEDKIDSKIEKVKIAGNKSVDLVYLLQNVSESVYYLKIKATNNGVSSIVNLRLTSDINKARINYPAINNFPILSGEETTLFSCFHTTSDVMEKAKLVLVLKDKNDQVITQGEYVVDIDSMMNGAKITFPSNKDYGFVSLKAELFDASGKVLDQYEVNYDCNLLGGEKCLSLNKNLISTIFDYIEIILIIVFLILSIYILGKIKKTESGYFSKKKISILLIVLILAIISLVAKIIVDGDFREVIAETTSANGRVKTETRSTAYSITGFSGNRHITSGNVSYTHTVSLNSDSVTRQPDNTWFIEKGSSFSFNRSGACSYTFNGGWWDTPVCGVGAAFGNSNNRTSGDVHIANMIPTVSVVSSNPSVVSCSGTSCTAVGDGCSTVNVNLSSMSTDPYAVASWSNKSGHGIATTPNWTSRGDFSHQRIILNATKVQLAGYSPSWTFCSATPTPLTVSCSVTPNPATVNEDSVTWRANVSGGVLSYLYSWEGTDGLTGDTNSVSKIYKTTGTKYATTTVSSGNQTVAVACPSSVTDDNGGGGSGSGSGVEIKSPEPIPGKCVVGGSYESIPTDPSFLCFTGQTGLVTGNGTLSSPWSWSCTGKYGDTSVDNCTALKTVSFDPDLDCTLKMETPDIGPVKVNTNTVWKVTASSTCSTCSKIWSVNGVAESETSDILNKIFTTTGEKTVSVKISSTTAAISGSVCTATTTVNQVGNLEEI
jgi:hypothetical protein